MKKPLIYLSILLNFGCFFIVDVLKWIYDTNHDSSEAFERYGTLLVPTRNAYLIALIAVNVVMAAFVIVGSFKGAPNGRRFSILEIIALFIAVLIMFLLAFAYFLVPRITGCC